MAGVGFHDLVWQSLYRRNLRLAERYRAGRVLLAGDAAHVGVEHGMNIGIQDAYNLGWKLAHVLSGSSEALLDTYEAERRPVVQRVMDAMSARLAAESGGGAAAARSIADAVTNTDPAADPTQLTLSYRGGPLCRDRGPASAVRAGDRAPDARCVDARSGAPRRLFDLFRGTHFTLLAFTDERLPHRLDAAREDLHVYPVRRPGGIAAPSAPGLIDADGEARHAYGVAAEAMVLVRPDGYVAFTGLALDGEEIAEYVGAILGTREPGR